MPRNASSLSSATVRSLCFMCALKVKRLCRAAMLARAKHKAAWLLRFWALSARHAAARTLPPSPPSRSGKGVGWPPLGLLQEPGAEAVFDSSLGKLFPPKASMQIGGGSSAASTKESPVQLVFYPQRKLWYVSKGTSAAGEGRSANSLCVQPILLAGELSTCHAGIPTLFWQTMEPRCPPLPARPLHAFSGMLVPKPDT